MLVIYRVRERGSDKSRQVDVVHLLTRGVPMLVEVKYLDL